MCLTRYQADGEMDPPSSNTLPPTASEIVYRIINQLGYPRRRCNPLDLEDVLSSLELTSEEAVPAMKAALKTTTTPDMLNRRSVTNGELQDALWKGWAMMSLTPQ